MKKVWRLGLILLMALMMTALGGCFLLETDPGETGDGTEIGSGDGGGGSQSGSGEEGGSGTTEPPIEPTISFTKEFSDGHYTAGIDFPGGTYNVTAVAGSGNASSSNMYSGGLNEIMGVEPDDLTSQTFNNAKLPDGTVLSIKNGLTVRIDSAAASAKPLKTRSVDPSTVYTFSNGNYTVGTDIKPGTYNVRAVSGKGNVTSSNWLGGYGLLGMMGVEDGSYDELYITQFFNLDLGTAGTTLEIKNGVTVELTRTVVS